MPTDNPWDEVNVRSRHFHAHAKLTRSIRNPEHFTLTLAVSDGPEAYTDFNPAERVNPDGECSLTEAIAKGVNLLIDAAQEDEAGRWIDDHREVSIVVGRTGQGADVQSWNVMSFASAERADGLRYRLNLWCENMGLAPNGSRIETIVDPQGNLVTCPEDPNFRIDGGTEYDVITVPLDMFDPISD